MQSFITEVEAQMLWLSDLQTYGLTDGHTYKMNHRKSFAVLKQKEYLFVEVSLSLQLSIYLY